MKKGYLILCFLFLCSVLFLYKGINAEDYPATIKFEKPVKGATFNHKGHIEMMGNDCESCHEKLFQYQIGAAGDAGDFNHKSFKAGKYCGGCHDGSNAFAMDNGCVKCHNTKEISDKVTANIMLEKPVKAVPFNHKGHIEMVGGDCESCHDKLFQFKIGAAADSGNFNHKSFKEGKYCGGCHDGSNAFAMDKECTKCHIGVKGYNKIKSGGKKEEKAHH